MKSNRTSNSPNRKPNWFYQFGLQAFKRVNSLVFGTRKFLRRSVRKFFSFPSTNWITSKILPDSESSKPPVWYQYLNPIAWFSWWMRFFAAWIVSRPYSAIGPALPAIVFVAFVLFATLKVKQSSQSDLRNAYTDAMARSMADANYDRAVVAADRLVDLFPRDFSFRMDRARIEIARGNDAAANMYFEQLASEGHAPALLWIASKRFDLTQTAKWTADEHAEFNRIYATLISTARGRDLVLAKKTLASYLIATGSLQLAKETLKELVQTDSGISCFQ